MIELYYWTTPNGAKPLLFLEETKLEYRIKPINIGNDEQFAPEFLAISPNNRIPAIVDLDPQDGGEQIAVFESGAILLYLAEKTGKYLPADLRQATVVKEWLMWQMGGVGPMFGQAYHFKYSAPEQEDYGIERYMAESKRLCGVLERRLAGRKYVADDYSIADMAIYPWLAGTENLEIDIAQYPSVASWQRRMEQRPAVRRTNAIAEKLRAETQAKAA